MLRPRFVFLVICFKECGGIFFFFFFFFNFFARKIDEKSVAYFGRNLHLKERHERETNNGVEFSLDVSATGEHSGIQSELCVGVFEITVRFAFDTDRTSRGKYVMFISLLSDALLFVFCSSFYARFADTLYLFSR